MYYARYSREARRWITSWPLPSEILARAKIEPAFEHTRPSGFVLDHSAEAVDDTPLNKASAENS